MPRAKNPAIVAFVSRQPACTRAESQLVPVCREEAMESLGAWRSATVLTDHISLEVGFSKQAMLAQCLTVDYGGGQEKFIHLKKKSPWFIAAVGGPNCKRSSLPAVRVIDALQSKLFCQFNKQVVDDADHGGDEVVDEACDPDPMDLLDADLGCPEVETQKNAGKKG